MTKKREEKAQELADKVMMEIENLLKRRKIFTIKVDALAAFEIMFMLQFALTRRAKPNVTLGAEHLAQALTEWFPSTENFHKAIVLGWIPEHDAVAWPKRVVKSIVTAVSHVLKKSVSTNPLIPTDDGHIRCHCAFCGESYNSVMHIGESGTHQYHPPASCSHQQANTFGRTL